jgi:hypothetical protein
MAPGAHQPANRQPFLDSRSPEQQLANIRVDRRRHHYTTLDLANKREEARELTRVLEFLCDTDIPADQLEAAEEKECFTQQAYNEAPAYHQDRQLSTLARLK